MHELKVKELKTWKEKTRGLIGSKQAEIILLKTRFGIHSFGLEFPIDVLILDSDFRVVRLAEFLQPNRIFLWLPIYNTIIELPAGEIQRRKIITGNIIKLNPR